METTVLLPMSGSGPAGHRENIMENSDLNPSNEIEVDSDGGVFKKGDILYYQHESGRVFSADTTDVGDLLDEEAITEEMTGMPHGVTAYEVDTDTIEGRAIDAWTNNVDDQIRREDASSSGGGGILTMSSRLRNQATASNIAVGGL